MLYGYILATAAYLSETQMVPKAANTDGTHVLNLLTPVWRVHVLEKKLMRQRVLITLIACITISLFSTAPYSGATAAHHAPEKTTCQGHGNSANSPATAAATGTPASIMNASAPHSITLENGGALLWSGGDRGVLLLHGAAYDAASWEVQAQVMSSHGYTVLALEDLSSSVVLEGIDFLMNDCGTKGVVVIGASAGGGAALNTLSSDPDGIAGLILLSATGDVKTLGDYPKLFIASKDEGFGDRLQTMAENAPGDQNETLILPGSAHAQAIFKGDQSDALLAAILAFLDQNARWKG